MLPPVSNLWFWKHSFLFLQCNWYAVKIWNVLRWYNRSLNSNCEINIGPYICKMLKFFYHKVGKLFLMHHSSPIFDIHIYAVYQHLNLKRETENTLLERIWAGRSDNRFSWTDPTWVFWWQIQKTYRKPTENLWKNCWGRFSTLRTCNNILKSTKKPQKWQDRILALTVGSICQHFELYNYECWQNIRSIWCLMGHRMDYFALKTIEVCWTWAQWVSKIKHRTSH